jgi:coenzyme F420-reducing hydrogenase beta subunit
MPRLTKCQLCGATGPILVVTLTIATPDRRKQVFNRCLAHLCQRCADGLAARASPAMVLGEVLETY